EGLLTELERGCRDQNIDYVQLLTDTPLSVALSSYLAHRLARKWLLVLATDHWPLATIADYGYVPFCNFRHVGDDAGGGRRRCVHSDHHPPAQPQALPHRHLGGDEVPPGRAETEHPAHAPGTNHPARGAHAYRAADHPGDGERDS